MKNLILTVLCAVTVFAQGEPHGSTIARPGAVIDNSLAATTKAIVPVAAAPSGVCTTKDAAQLYQLATTPQLWVCNPDAGTACPCTWRQAGASQKVYIFSQVSGFASATNTTTATTLGTVTIPAGLLVAGANVRMIAKFTHTAGTTLTPRVSFGFGGASILSASGLLAATDANMTLFADASIISTTSQWLTALAMRPNPSLNPVVPVAGAVDVTGSVAVTMTGWFTTATNPGESISGEYLAAIVTLP